MEAIFTTLVDRFISGSLSRRDLIQSLAAASVVTGAPATAAPTPARRDSRAVAVNHISYQVKDYAKTRDFYAKTFGMKVSHDNGRQAFLTFGDTFLILRQPGAGEAAPLVDHLAFTIDGYGLDVPNFKADNESMGAELKARGLNPEVDTELSWTVKDPDGYTVQLAPAIMKPGHPLFEKVMTAQGRPASGTK